MMPVSTGTILCFIPQNETLYQDDAQSLVDVLATVRGAVILTENTGGCD